MAKRNEKKINCRVTYTEGCEQRLTKALVEVYYARKERGIESNVTNKAVQQMTDSRQVG